MSHRALPQLGNHRPASAEWAVGGRLQLINFHHGSVDGAGSGFWRVGRVGVSGDSISCTDPADYGGEDVGMGVGGAPSQVGGPFFKRSPVKTVPLVPPDIKVGNYTEAGWSAMKAMPTV